MCFNKTFIIRYVLLYFPLGKYNNKLPDLFISYKCTLLRIAITTVNIDIKIVKQPTDLITTLHLTDPSVFKSSSIKICKFINFLQAPFKI